MNSSFKVFLGHGADRLLQADPDLRASISSVTSALANDATRRDISSSNDAAPVHD